MDEPTTEQRIAVLEQRMDQYRVQHFSLQLDIEAAKATETNDAPSVVHELLTKQWHIEKAYNRMKEMLEEVPPSP